MKLATAYAFNDDEEQFLGHINNVLAEQHQQSLNPLLGEDFVTLHVIGPPRAGTTLAMQLIASGLSIGYVSNLAAVFWRAPCYGLRLHIKLLGKQFQSTLRSEFGRTSNPEEPHEFGRFWQEILGIEDMIEPLPQASRIDWALVRTTLVNMTHAWSGPLAFKSFVPIWHLDQLAHAMSRSVFVRLRRDRQENAASLLLTRRAYVENETDWVGLQPLRCRPFLQAPVPLQVAAQIHYIDDAIDKRLRAIAPNRLLEVNYEDICNNPNGFLDSVGSLISNHQEGMIQRDRSFDQITPSRPQLRLADLDRLTIEKAFTQLDAIVDS